MSIQSQLDQLKKKIETQTRMALQKIAKEMVGDVVEYIKMRTQQGQQGTNGQLKGLKESTIKNRERYSGNLSDQTSPSTSNATATGQLIASIQGKNIGTRMVIEPNKKKRGKTLSGGKDKLNNQQVLKYYEDTGREFLKLSDKEKDELRKAIAEKLGKELSSRLK